MVYPALLPLMRTSRLPVVDWTDAPRRFKWTRPFRRKIISGFCACAITFQTHSTYNYITSIHTSDSPVPWVARSKASVCELSLAGIAGSNLAGGMDVSLLLSIASGVCCQVEVPATDRWLVRKFLTDCCVSSWGRSRNLDNNNNNNNNNNKNNCQLQLGCHPVVVVILHVYKIWNWLLL